LKYIPIVAYHNGLVCIRDMDEFASYYCYAIKQKTVPARK
jgi:hypothetical protein